MYRKHETPTSRPRKANYRATGVERSTTAVLAAAAAVSDVGRQAPCSLRPLTAVKQQHTLYTDEAIHAGGVVLLHSPYLYYIQASRYTMQQLALPTEITVSVIGIRERFQF